MFRLTDLPYEPNDLEPVISAATFTSSPPRSISTDSFKVWPALVMVAFNCHEPPYGVSQ